MAALPDDSNPIKTGLLRLRGERRGEEGEGDGASDERAPVHH